MLGLLLDNIASLGTAEAQKLLSSAGNSALKNYKDALTWKKTIVETGEFFIKNENDQSLFFDDLKIVLSEKTYQRLQRI